MTQVGDAALEALHTTATEIFTGAIKACNIASEDLPWPWCEELQEPRRRPEHELRIDALEKRMARGQGIVGSSTANTARGTAEGRS